MDRTGAVIVKACTRGAAVIALLTLGRGLIAQRDRRAAEKPLPIRETIAAAEAEGAAYPRGPARERLATVFVGRSVGTTERKCVDGPTTKLAVSQIRSGDFVIGGQIGGWRTPLAGKASKIWWAPYHNPLDDSATLVVRGARLGHPGDTIRYKKSDIGYAMFKSDAFFPSGLFLPRAGSWLLVATAGDDWGCFILTAT